MIVSFYSLHDRQLLRASGVMTSIPPLANADTRVANADTRVARKVRLDRGYCGAENEWAKQKDIEVVIGVKGTRKHPLTALDRAWNAVLSKKRMQVEQCIGHLKTFRLLSGLYRGQIKRHQGIMSVIAGLHNYRLLPEGTW